MSEIKCLDRLIRLNDFFVKGIKGDASYFSSRLEISERTFYRLIKCLKEDYKLDIKFDRYSKTYYLD